ncbi:hypothetical protein C3747_144g98 [Trypanosoma cruzi]|uniref:Uncharacterized protein n=2 Tax=Trypanosoma cruzi TaxID=5693 RepID=Q4CXZ1_TRYCC|nr:hypothetical protein, conserved [Trypanosoma cruzi]EAN85146.1 hypothetical protein, conserved [Trypanosoma cruzi]PWV04773.1 hypothetical protein C3747_144g98 [Trypanosoma cruzi]RNC46370.1 WD repeat domain 31 [Trypanosoma cruzi]|eukprot:XP_806997.1 hypothetical protein [Trypanosoma cruzi strain CL Brener]
MGLYCFRRGATSQKSGLCGFPPFERKEERNKLPTRKFDLTVISQRDPPAPVFIQDKKKKKGRYRIEGDDSENSHVSRTPMSSVPYLKPTQFQSFAGLFGSGTAALTLRSCEDSNMPHHLIVGGEDGNLVLVDYELGTTTRRWYGAHGRDVNSLTRPLSSGVFASASRDKIAKVWNLHSGEALCELHGHTANVTSVTMGAEHNFLVSGSRDNTVRLWDLERAEEVQCCEIKQNIVQFTQWVPQLHCVAQGGEDLTVRLWDVRMNANGKKALGLSLATTLACIEYHPICCELIPGEETCGLLTGHNGFNGHGAYVVEWDLRMPKCLRIFHGHTGTVRSIRTLPRQDPANHGEFVSAGDDGAMIFFSIGPSSHETDVAYDPRSIFKLNEGRVTCLDVCANGDIFSSMWDGAVSVLRCTSPKKGVKGTFKRFRCFGAEELPK